MEVEVNSFSHLADNNYGDMNSVCGGSNLKKVEASWNSLLMLTLISYTHAFLFMLFQLELEWLVD